MWLEYRGLNQEMRWFDTHVPFPRKSKDYPEKSKVITLFTPNDLKKVKR